MSIFYIMSIETDKVEKHTVNLGTKEHVLGDAYTALGKNKP